MKRFFLPLLAALLMAGSSCLAAVPPAAAPPALVLSDPALPGDDPSLDRTLEQALRGAGYAPKPVSADALLAPDALTPTRCALLALPRAAMLPAALAQPLDSYLRAGGHLLALGTPLWHSLLVKGAGGRWRTTEQAAEDAALAPPPHILFGFTSGGDLSGWKRTSNAMATPTRFTTEPASAAGRTAGALHVVIPNLTGWDTMDSPAFRTPFPAGDAQTVFSAKGDARTRELAVEWDEQDGSRWIATVPLTPVWRQYALPPSAFRPWLVSKERSQQGFLPADAVRMSFGLAFSHTGHEGGRKEYWVAALGTAPTSAESLPTGQTDLPRLDTLAPDYKLFAIHGPVRLATANEGGVAAVPVPATMALRSPQPRPSGTGFDKRRGWRWAPLLIASDSRSGAWRGAPATLLLHAPGSAAPYAGGIWASFAVDDPAFYRSPAVRQLLARTLRRMHNGLFLIEGGAQFYTLFPGQPVRLGAQAADLAPSGTAGRTALVRIRVTTASGGRVVWKQEWPLFLHPGAGASVEGAMPWTPPAAWPAGGYTVTTELLAGGQVVDRLAHGLYVWTPSPHPDFVTIRPDGHFYLKGRLWRANGVNYMPSSGIGVEDNEFFEQWLSGPSYDPEIIERDLTRISGLGLNAVSVFLDARISPSQNLLDLLRRCREHHLHVNLGLRPVIRNFLTGSDAAAAVRQAEDGYRTIVTANRLSQNDSIFAYDIDWEPVFGDYEQRSRHLDPAWERWVMATYGSIPAAERAWGVGAPRTANGRLTGPSDAALSAESGPEAKLAVAYRRFLDDWLTATYGPPVRMLHTLDPHHDVSFRMSEAGDPTNDQAGGLPYQFEGLARVVDFLAPEGYGRIGDWERVKPGWFGIAYGRAVAPRKPILWAEAGETVWDEAAQRDDPERLRFQGAFYADFYKMARLSGADGIFWWWLPGGYRVNEKSDFGLLNPDGTDRPASAAVRLYGPAFRDAPAPAKPDLWLTFDRDAHPNGIAGVYRELAPAFWKAVSEGKRPGLRVR